jgi:hypothetical protein
VCRFSFYTGFIQNYTLQLNKSQMDEACKDDKNDKFDECFQCTVLFEPVEYRLVVTDTDAWGDQSYQDFFAGVCEASTTMRSVSWACGR